MGNSPKFAENVGRYGKMSKEEHKAICSLGGKAHAKQQKRHRDLRLIATAMLDAEPLETDEVYAELDSRGFDNSYAAAIMLSAISKAMHGDIEAARFVRDTAGQKPKDQVEIGNIDGIPLMRKEMSNMSDEAIMALIQEAEEME